MISENQDETCLIITINDTSTILTGLILIINSKAPIKVDSNPWTQVTRNQTLIYFSSKSPSSMTSDGSPRDREGVMWVKRGTCTDEYRIHLHKSELLFMIDISNTLHHVFGRWQLLIVTLSTWFDHEYPDESRVTNRVITVYKINTSNWELSHTVCVYFHQNKKRRGSFMMCVQL